MPDQTPSAQPRTTRVLMLRVYKNGKIVHDDFLRPGLSIGRAPNNSIQIKSKYAQRFHAVVTNGRHGQLVLDCIGDALISLGRGRRAQWQLLEDGVRFSIGPAEFECISREVAAVDVFPITTQPHETSRESRRHSRGPFCLQCHLSLTHVPHDALFCPRCGDTLARQREFHAHSEMLRGYGAAMQKLGFMYEQGRGVQKNEDEAIRCYSKAARFGNPEAKKHLESRGGTSEMEPQLDADEPRSINS